MYKIKQINFLIILLFGIILSITIFFTYLMLIFWNLEFYFQFLYDFWLFFLCQLFEFNYLNLKTRYKKKHNYS